MILMKAAKIISNSAEESSDSVHESDGTSPPTLHALQWARVLQIIQKHGFTGILVVLLAYQFGWLASAQSTACGL